jgi:hypothetical protein
MAPVDEGGEGGEGAGGAGGEDAAGGLGAGGGSYVPPHMRKGAAAGGERMAGKYEKDDLATLRVTNVCLSPALFLLPTFFSPTFFPSPSIPFLSQIFGEMSVS